jgi:hypothetical protein
MKPDRDDITPQLAALAAQLKNTRPLMAACGQQLANDLRAHFAALDAKPNKRHWPKRHFWSRQVRSHIALTEVTATRAVVTIASPELMHVINGGVITPKRGKTLAIPANAEAYKAGSPREADSDQLDFVPLYQGNLVGALIRRLQTVLTRTAKGFKGREVGWDVWYWLVRSVRHEPRPEVMPDEAKLKRRVLTRAHAFVDNTMAAGSANAFRQTLPGA